VLLALLMHPCSLVLFLSPAYCSSRTTFIAAALVAHMCMASMRGCWVGQHMMAHVLLLLLTMLLLLKQVPSLWRMLAMLTMRQLGV
jgi:hypothetical protein